MTVFYEVFFIVMFYYVSFSSLINFEWIIQKMYNNILQTDKIQWIQHLQELSFSLIHIGNFFFLWINSFLSEKHFKIHNRILLSFLLLFIVITLLLLFCIFQSSSLILFLVKRNIALGILFFIYLSGGISVAFFQSNIIYISQEISGDLTKFLSILSINFGFILISIGGYYLLSCCLSLLYIYCISLTLLVLSFILYCKRIYRKYDEKFRKTLFDQLYNSQNQDDDDDDVYKNKTFKHKLKNPNSHDNNSNNNKMKNILSINNENQQSLDEMSQINCFHSLKLIIIYCIAHFLNGLSISLLSIRTISYIYKNKTMIYNGWLTFSSIKIYLMVYNAVGFIGTFFTKIVIYRLDYIGNKQTLFVCLSLLFTLIFIVLFCFPQTNVFASFFSGISIGIIYVISLDRIEEVIMKKNKLFSYCFWLSSFVFGMIIGTNFDILISTILIKLF